VARADYPQAEACPHTPRTPREEGLEDDVREVGLLGNDLPQPLGGDREHLPTLAHHGREVHRLPGKHIQVAHETARAEDPHRPRFISEVVYYLHLAFEDDDEVVGKGACPKEDLLGLRLPRLPVATQDIDLIFTQCRGPRAADLLPLSTLRPGTLFFELSLVLPPIVTVLSISKGFQRG
jgi:hypothetical protein